MIIINERNIVDGEIQAEAGLLIQEVCNSRGRFGESRWVVSIVAAKREEANRI